VFFDVKAFRFCQKCTRFHELETFEGEKHTCREELQKQREKRLVNMQARRGKLAAGGTAAAAPLASASLVGSKRAAPVDDSLLANLGHETKLGGSFTIGLDMAQQVHPCPAGRLMLSPGYRVRYWPRGVRE
jgi:hypothetical protein